MTSFNEWVVNSGLKDDLDTKITLLTAELVSTIAIRRRGLGLTQEELGNLANLSPSQIAQLEGSSHIPKLDTVMRAALALNLKVALTAEEPHLHHDEHAADMDARLSQIRNVFTPEVVHTLAEFAKVIKSEEAGMNAFRPERITNASRGEQHDDS